MINLCLTNIGHHSRHGMRSVREIRQRRSGNRYQSPLNRIVYALLSSLMYGFIGLVIDLAIVIIRSLANVGNGEVFWLFAPFMLVLGAIIGFITGKNAGANSMEALPIKQGNHLAHNDDYSVRHDVFRGLGIGIVIFPIIWLIMMLIM